MKPRTALHLLTFISIFRPIIRILSYDSLIGKPWRTYRGCAAIGRDPRDSCSFKGCLHFFNRRQRDVAAVLEPRHGVGRNPCLTCQLCRAPSQSRSSHLNLAPRQHFSP